MRHKPKMACAWLNWKELKWVASVGAGWANIWNNHIRPARENINALCLRMRVDQTLCHNFPHFYSNYTLYQDLPNQMPIIFQYITLFSHANFTILGFISVYICLCFNQVHRQITCNWCRNMFDYNIWEMKVKMQMHVHKLMCMPSGQSVENMEFANRIEQQRLARHYSNIHSSIYLLATHALIEPIIKYSR